MSQEAKEPASIATTGPMGKGECVWPTASLCQMHPAYLISTGL